MMCRNAEHEEFDVYLYDYTLVYSIHMTSHESAGLVDVNCLCEVCLS